MEAEHHRTGFHAIVARSNPRKDPCVIVSDLLESSPLWNLARTVFPSRRAEDMAAAVQGLLASATLIYFVDPYFRAHRPNWRRPIDEFLRCIRENVRTVPGRVVLFCSADIERAPSNSHFAQECKAHLSQEIPAGARLLIQRLTQKSGGEKLHDRFILTDCGGVDFGAGLAEGNEGETVIISLLDKGGYAKLFADYCGPRMAFDRAGNPVEVVGVVLGPT